MTDVSTLIRRIDDELAVDIKAQKAAWDEVVRINRERGPRLQRYEAAAKHAIDLLKPRLGAVTERFKDVVKAQPTVHEYLRGINLTFASTVAKVTLAFEVFPDEDVSHVRFECAQEIVPVLVPYDKQSVLELALDAVRDDAVVQWFDERIVAFVKAYVALVRQDFALKEQLKDNLVEDPITKIRFPKYLSSSTLERDGKIFYFVGEDTRREFEKQPTTK